MTLVFILIAVAVCIVIGIVTVSEIGKQPSTDEKKLVRPTFPEVQRLISGDVPAWVRGNREHGYEPRDVYYAGRDTGHTPSVMRRRLLEFKPPATRAARRWWNHEVEAAYALDKSLPKPRKRDEDDD